MQLERLVMMGGSPGRVEESSFGARARAAVAEGAILGLKFGTAIVIIAVVLQWFAGDYANVRQMAVNGQRAFEFLQSLPAPPPKPAPPAQ